MVNKYLANAAIPRRWSCKHNSFTPSNLCWLAKRKNDDFVLRELALEGMISESKKLTWKIESPYN